MTDLRERVRKRIQRELEVHGRTIDPEDLAAIIIVKIGPILDEGHSAAVKEFAKYVRTVKPPLGEREWCVECADRISAAAMKAMFGEESK